MSFVALVTTTENTLGVDQLSEDLINSNCMGIRNIATLAVQQKCRQFIYYFEK